MVELLTGVAWAAMFWRLGLSVGAVVGALFMTLLLGIAMTDAREYIIPDEFTIGGLVAGLVLAAIGGTADLTQAILGAGVGFLLLWLVGAGGTWLFKEEAMGGGDIKMMAMVGAFVGWQGVLLTVFLGALAGTIIFLPLTLLGRKKLVPFGVFLAVGAAITYWLSADANGAFVVFHERAAWEAAVGDFVTIDFTGFPDDTVITDQYANQGVVFSDGNDRIRVSESLFPLDGAGLRGGPFDDIGIALLDRPLRRVRKGSVPFDCPWGQTPLPAPTVDGRGGLP
jgi:Flp pilus assembly protein protease CpaA